MHIIRINRNPYRKYLVLGLLLACLLLTSVGCAITDALHYEDQNGEDDYSLALLTEEEMISSTKNIKELSTKTNLNGVVTLTSSRFSGVMEVERLKTAKKTIVLHVESTVTQGNLGVFISNGETIVSYVPINSSETLKLPGGSYSFRIAGESAKYELVYSVEYTDEE